MISPRFVSSRTFYWSLMPLVLLLASCGGADTDGSAQPETFDAFYHRFMLDRSFQMSRIIFPLPERLADETDWAAADSAGHGSEMIRYWHPANWPYLERPAPPSDSLRHETEVSDTTHRLRLTIPDADGFAEMRFRRIEGKWYLTYFFSNL